MTKPVEALANLMNKLEECNPICIIEKDTLSFIPTPSDVVDSTAIYDPQRSGHGRSPAETNVVLQDLTLRMGDFPGNSRTQLHPASACFGNRTRIDGWQARIIVFLGTDCGQILLRKFQLVAC